MCINSHEQFLLATLAYNANAIEPGIDKRNGELKFWHTTKKQFVPIKSIGMAMSAMDYCVFAACYVTLN